MSSTLSRLFALPLLLAGFAYLAPPGRGQEPPPKNALPADWVKLFDWRSIGPANMAGRVTALAVFEADPTCYYVATASGGLLKTINNGITFEHQFDKESTVSIGAVAVAPTDRNIVWVGTGEANPRNSVSYGDGVYKSVDGGKTWKNMGLKAGYQVGKILIHPTNPEIVYVGVLGRLYGPSEERGLFKTANGGKTWDKVLFTDDKTGVIDVVMSPKEPDTLIVGMWERKRDGFDGFFANQAPPAGEQYGPIVTYGKGGGLHKTTDGGKTWKRLDKGLPTAPMGRIGLDWSRKNPSNVYAILSTDKIGTGLEPPAVAYMGIIGETDDGGAKLTQVTEGGPADKAGLKVDDVVTSFGGKMVPGYEEFIAELQSKKPDDKVKIDFRRGNETKSAEVVLAKRPEPMGGERNVPSVAIGVRSESVPGGVKLAEILPNGAAKKANLMPDDLLVAIDGKEVANVQAMLAVFATKKPGDKIKVTILREKVKQDVEVTLEARPAATRNDRPYASQLGGQKENVQATQGPDGFQTGGVYKSADAGETWTRINSVNPRPMYFSVVRVDPNDENTLYVLGVTSMRSTDGGRVFRPWRTRGVHADHHDLWIDPRDSRHLIFGTDGGFYASYDRGAKWDHINTAALGQFYHVAADNRRPYRVYGGLQDNGSWGGPSQVLRGGGPINADFFTVGGGDGFVCRVDPNDPDLIYTESQNGRLARRHLKTGERKSIGIDSPEGGPGYRWNWNTPFILSDANSSILYTAGNFVFRSLDRGDHWTKVSPEIAKTPRGSGTAVAESPRNAEVLWAGTDDGAIWVTRDAGAKWVEVSGKVGLPGPRWVATIEPSRAVEGRAYVCFDGHRSDDDEPHLYVTEDFGATWKSIRANLPKGSTRVLREDATNPELLYVGTEFGVWASTNRGQSWTRINNNLPTVAVHEFAQPTTANEIVAATHGRSLWVLDVTALRQLRGPVWEADAHLFAPSPAVRWSLEPGKESPYSSSARQFAGRNPDRAVKFEYVVNKPAEKASLKVTDIAGKVLRELKAPSGSGLHRVAWDVTTSTPRPPVKGKAVPPEVRAARYGTYRVVLTVDGKEYVQPVAVEPDPNNPRPFGITEEETEEEEERRLDD